MGEDEGKGGWMGERGLDRERMRMVGRGCGEGIGRGRRVGRGRGWWGEAVGRMGFEEDEGGEGDDG